MIQILEENDFFLVLMKPATYSVHNQKPSLVEYLTSYKKPIHFVNRLDQETSGLMIIAQKPEYHAELSYSLEAGHKFYRALLRGSWKHKEKNLVLNWPLSDKSEGRKNPQGLTQDRKASETKLEMVRSNSYLTEAIAEILTGRQHQIRKHCALAKLPIVGDKRYNEVSYNNRIAKIYGETRMQLHAEKLEFQFKNKNYKFESQFSLNHFFEEKVPGPISPIDG